MKWTEGDIKKVIWEKQKNKELNGQPLHTVILHF